MSVNPVTKCSLSHTIASTHPTRVIRAIAVTTVIVAIRVTAATIVTTAITATVVITVIQVIVVTTVTIAIAAIPAMGTTITIITTITTITISTISITTTMLPGNVICIIPLFIGTTELLLIVGLVLLLFGGKKLPELMKGLGQGVRSFKQGVNEPLKEEKSNEFSENEVKLPEESVPEKKKASNGKT